MVREGRIRTEIFFWKKGLESSETCKNAKKVVHEGSIQTENIFLGKTKVLQSSETCKGAKKEWSRKVEFGRKKFFWGKKKV